MIDAEKSRLMRGASYLLPDPGGEVVRELLDELDRLRVENEALRNYLRMIEHATASTPDDDGGYHENAYSLAVEALRDEGE